MDPLITMGELDDYLQRTVPPARAALAVAGASGIVRAHCGWDISQELGATFKLNGSGSRVLGLPTLHLTGVDSVVVDGEPVTDFKWSISGQLYAVTAWARWSTVVVVADSGYAEIPDVVKIVSLSLATRLVNNPEALKSATVGAVSRVYADAGLNTLELALLDAFRLP